MNFNDVIAKMDPDNLWLKKAITNEEKRALFVRLVSAVHDLNLDWWLKGKMEFAAGRDTIGKGRARLLAIKCKNDDDLTVELSQKASRINDYSRPAKQLLTEEAVQYIESKKFADAISGYMNSQEVREGKWPKDMVNGRLQP